MRSEDKHALRSVFVPRPDPQRMRAHQNRLEADLLERFAARSPGPRWGRRMLIGAAVCAGAVAACQFPADYEMPLGHRITIRFDEQLRQELDPTQMAALLREQFPVESMGIRARVRRQADDAGREQTSMELELELAGTDLDIDAVEEALVESFPILERAQIEIDAVHERVEGTLGGKLSGGWLDEVIDRHGVEEAKRRIRRQLEAEGLPPDAKVDVKIEDSPGRREIRVSVEHDEDELEPEP